MTRLLLVKIHVKGDVDDTLGLQSAWLIYEGHVGTYFEVILTLIIYEAFSN